MGTYEYVAIGAALGAGAVLLYNALNPSFDPNAGIDPTTGGVQLPAGATYGPAVPIDPTTGGVELAPEASYGPTDPTSTEGLA